MVQFACTRRRDLMAAHSSGQTKQKPDGLRTVNMQIDCLCPFFVLVLPLWFFRKLLWSIRGLRIRIVIGFDGVERRDYNWHHSRG